jgi:predicted DsbA family dithiol-disulfide isomerase
LAKDGVDKLAIFTNDYGMTDREALAKMEHIRETSMKDEDDLFASGLHAPSPHPLSAKLCPMNFAGQRAGNSENAQMLIHAIYQAGANSSDDLKWLSLTSEIHKMYNCEQKWPGDAAVLKEAAERVGIKAGVVPSVLDGDRTDYDNALAHARNIMNVNGASGVPLFLIQGHSVLKGAASVSDLIRVIKHAADRPEILARHYVDLANAHDIEGLTAYLHPNVDMFGGPCDRQGLVDFFAGYPGIKWEIVPPDACSASPRTCSNGVEASYRVDDSAAPGERTVTFSYKRSWDNATKENGTMNGRWFVLAEEAITFDGKGKVTKIEYTKQPSEKQPCMKEEL